MNVTFAPFSNFCYCPAGDVCFHACGERNAFWDPGPGKSQTSYSLGAARLRRAVHLFQEVLHHFPHHPVSSLCSSSTKSVKVLFLGGIVLSAAVSLPQILPRQFLHEIRHDPLRDQHGLAPERPDPQAAAAARSEDPGHQQVLSFLSEPCRLASGV